ncbi:MAG: hypothetical protein QOI98_358, partial [Solirubrobacteraceae bacterium]|nr:hypothetical protein [Solirubrobacteraceae bacterium]
IGMLVLGLAGAYLSRGAPLATPAVARSRV